MASLHGQAYCTMRRPCYASRAINTTTTSGPSGHSERPKGAKNLIPGRRFFTTITGFFVASLLRMTKRRPCYASRAINTTTTSGPSGHSERPKGAKNLVPGRRFFTTITGFFVASLLRMTKRKPCYASRAINTTTASGPSGHSERPKGAKNLVPGRRFFTTITGWAPVKRGRLKKSRRPRGGAAFSLRNRVRSGEFYQPFLVQYPCEVQR